MNPLFTQGDLGPFLSLRLSLERAIRTQCSEHAILRVHDALYSPIKRSTAQVHDAIEASRDHDLDSHSISSLRLQHRHALATLRNLLETRAKERALQDALVDSGMLALNCRVVQEVTMNPTKDYRGMRMDLVLVPETEEPTQIVELKRGSHLLLARRGKPTERLSQELKRAIKQTRDYRDAATAVDLDKRLGIRFENPVLRLIAGRRLPDAHDYHLLSLAETDASDPSLQLQIHTWDGLLAELERVFD
jgi:hypothetical protein